MASVEERIASAILTRIRALRKQPRPAPTTQTGTSSSPAVQVGQTKLREALMSDFESVRELKRRWGLIPDSFENWERLWRDNPALKDCPHALPIGWVLEAEGRVVGYLGNIASTYYHGDRKLTAVTGHGLVVDPLHRALSMTLNAAFYRQKSVDLYLSTTAIEVVGKIAQVFKCKPLPQPDYEKVLFWVLRPHSFAKEVTKKLCLGPAASRVGAMLASLAVRLDKALRRRWPRQSSKSLAIKEISVAEIGDDFGRLWTKKLAERFRLLADRSPATLRWHFETPGDRGATRVLSCSRNRELVGYAIIRDDPNQTEGLRKSIIADMLVEQDNSEIHSALIVAAYYHAKHAGSHILEVLGFPQTVRSVCSRWNPYLRKRPSCPFYYKAADPALHEQLADASAWYASPFDGDTTLMPLLGSTNK
jgi:hypothetical protein